MTLFQRALPQYLPSKKKNHNTTAVYLFISHLISHPSLWNTCLDVLKRKQTRSSNLNTNFASNPHKYTFTVSHRVMWSIQHYRHLHDISRMRVHRKNVQDLHNVMWADDVVAPFHQRGRWKALHSCRSHIVFLETASVSGNKPSIFHKEKNLCILRKQQ